MTLGTLDRPRSAGNGGAAPSMIWCRRFVPAITNVRSGGISRWSTKHALPVGSGGTLKKIAPALVPIALLAALLSACGAGTGVGTAAVGACAAETEPGEPSSRLEVRDCADPAAGFVVLAQVEGTKDCFTIDGTVTEATESLPERRTCIGVKGADPKRSTNTAAAGECLTEQGDQRTPCTAPDAVHRIVQRLDAVPAAATATACDAVPGSEVSITAGTAVTTSVATFGTGTRNSDTAVVFCAAAVTR